jgi:hypothetical protein
VLGKLAFAASTGTIGTFVGIVTQTGTNHLPSILSGIAASATTGAVVWRVVVFFVAWGHRQDRALKQVQKDQELILRRLAIVYGKLGLPWEEHNE